MSVARVCVLCVVLPGREICASGRSLVQRSYTDVVCPVSVIAKEAKAWHRVGAPREGKNRVLSGNDSIM